MAEPVIKVSVTVTMEMTEAQRDAYTEEFGAGFVGIEVAARLRPEMEVALWGTPWLSLMQRRATVTISEPAQVKTTGECDGADREP